MDKYGSLASVKVGSLKNGILCVLLYSSDETFYADGFYHYGHFMHQYPNRSSMCTTLKLQLSVLFSFFEFYLVAFWLHHKYKQTRN